MLRGKKPGSPVYEGSVLPKDHGVLDCIAPCLVSHEHAINFLSCSELVAWSFLVLSQKGDTLPEISFGLKDDSKDILCFDYFRFVSNMRQTFPRVPLSIDGLCCALRFLVDQGRVSIYICDTCVFTTTITGSGRFFIRVARGECSLMTSAGVDQSHCSWFPGMFPVRWRTKDSTLLLRGNRIRKAQSESTGLVCAFTTSGMEPIPGTTVIYFEVRCDYVNPRDEVQRSGIAVGFSPIIGPFQSDEPGIRDRSIGFCTRDNKIMVGPGEGTATGFSTVKIGDVIGIGLNLETGRLFAALNGKVVDSEYRLENVAQEMHAVVGLMSISDECTVNFGKEPFVYGAVNPPEGWGLYEPETTCLWSRGPEVYCHIEGYYRDLGLYNQTGVMVGTKPLGERDRFEVTFEKVVLKETQSDAARAPGKGLSIGVGFPECANSSDVVSESGCVVVECAKGGLFDGEPEQAQSFNLTDLPPKTRTIGFGRNGNEYEFSVENKSFEFPSRQEGLQNYPVFIWQNMSHVFVNCGQVPFVKGYDAGDGVKLFNHIHVKMSEEGLDEFGLMKDDVVESRDRLFFGKVAGLYKGRPFFIVPGIDGAVCLNSTDPLFHRMLLRIVSRPSLESFWSPCITVDGVERVNVGHGLPYSPMTLFFCPFGVSLFVGSTSTGNCVVRRVNDLVTSSNAIVLGQPSDISRMVVGSQGEKFRDTECTWFKSSAKLWPLDVTVWETSKNNKQNLCVVIGYNGDQIIGYDGNRVVEIPSDATPVFRFIGYDKGVEGKIGQFVGPSVSVASFLSAGVTTFSNEMCGVYGLHVIVNQSGQFPPWQCNSFSLPPYVDKTFKSLLEENKPTIERVDLEPVDDEGVFYECDALDGDDGMTDPSEKPGVIVMIDEESPRKALCYY